jgi:hypothetical protein
MAHWIDDYPAMRIMRRQMQAPDYNGVRVALARHRLPWNVPLKGLRCLHCILDESTWVCVDTSQRNLPILAWTKFKASQRAALDAPVECELRAYHVHAGLIMGQVLEELTRAVTEHGDSSATEPHRISLLNTTEKSL